MALTVEPTITIAHEELPGSPVEEFTTTGSRATRRLKCAWDDRYTLRNQLLGVSLGLGGHYVATLPAAYPHTDVLRVTEVNIAPFHPSQVTNESGTAIAASVDAAATYEDAALEVIYEKRHTDIFEVTVNPSAEFLTVPPTGLYWDNAQANPLLPEEAPGILVGRTDFAMRYYYVPNTTLATKVDTILGLVGKVNSVIMQFSLWPQWAIPVGTLLFAPPKFSEVATPDGEFAWNVDYLYQYRHTGWNNFFRQSTNTWAAIYDAGGTAWNQYPLADLTPAWFTSPEP